MSNNPAEMRNCAGHALAGLALALVLNLPFGPFEPAASAELTLDAAVHNPQRSAKFVARDSARHPLEELAFFGVTPQSTVVEIWPGGGYWTEILAPFLQDHGVYYVALQGKAEAETARAEAEKLNAAARRSPLMRRPTARSSRPCSGSERPISRRPDRRMSC
jgi:predicted methyltransferase